MDSPARFPSLHRPTPVTEAQNEHWPEVTESLLHSPATKQSSTLITRKPLPSDSNDVLVEDSNGRKAANDSAEKLDQAHKREGTYWLTPTAAVLLFLLGLAAAIAHYVYFIKIKGKPVGDQTWTLRYSLAIAFIFKSVLAASTSIALAQHAWMMLRHSKRGTPVSTIDAMFLGEHSLFMFLSPSLWLSAFSTGLMALCIWLMPLTALVAPTSLTVGLSVTDTTIEGCLVPTVNFGLERNSSFRTKARSLFVTDNSDLYTRPSASSERLSASVLTNGRQIPWQSPCGLNCTYEIEFTGPSWQCTRAENVDDPRAPWKPEYGDGSFWYWGNYGDGSNLTVTASNASQLIYSPVYYAGLNSSTNQFWAGFAAGFTRGLDPSEGRLGESLREILDMQVYSCQVANTSYTVDVEFVNGVQSNTIRKAVPFSTFDISPQGWQGEGSYTVAGDKYEQSLPIALQDIVGMYTPMINYLSGWIYRDPRYELVTNTSLGLVPPLITDLPIYNEYATETPYLPSRDLGKLLEELSHNLTISLISDPDLLITTTALTTCERQHTQSVWKFNWRPLVAAYATGLGVTLICLVIGAYALSVNGVAHDTSFSSVVRTTRNGGLDVLCTGVNDSGALPLTERAKKVKLGFVNGDHLGEVSEDKGSRQRTGFMVRAVGET